MLQETGSLDNLLDGIRAAADPSRLRLLAICSQGEWTVSELVQILGQSQPRISRHLKILAEAGLLDRFREGSWVFYRRAQNGEGARLARSLCRLLPGDDTGMLLGPAAAGGGARGAPPPGRALLRRPRRRLGQRARPRRSTAPWSRPRCASCSPRERPASLLDIGTGTGRILQVLAGQVGFGLGIDLSHDMLAVARANLDRREARNCQVRHGDMYQLPLPDGSFAAATLHQVLHFADDPFAALAEAVRVLAPGGRLVVVDLAPPRRRAAARARAAIAGSASATRRSAAGSRSSGWSPSEPRRLAGPELTVVIWTARRPPGRRRRRQPFPRRSAA